MVRASGSRAGRAISKTGPITGYFITDFLASEFGVIVEVDGGYHDRHRKADAHRDRKVRRDGSTVLHIIAELVEHDLPETVSRIRDENSAISSRGSLQTPRGLPLPIKSRSPR